MIVDLSRIDHQLKHFVSLFISPKIDVFLLATFDVQNGSLAVINSTIGEVCFTCYFLEGSQSQGCYIEYNYL